MPDYAAHEAVYFSQAITADDFAMKKNPKYVNKVVAPTLEPISSIGGFRTLPDYSFDTMPDDYVALVLIGGFGWNTPVAEKVMPIIKSAGLDWKSGATRHRSILGKNNRANGAYAIIQYLANGDLLFNSVAGPIRVKY